MSGFSSLTTLSIKSKMNPEIVAQKQLDAFNARDIEVLLSIYAPDAELFIHPATPLAKGGMNWKNYSEKDFRNRTSRRYYSIESSAVTR